jgi:hypothetical protein
VFLLLEYVNSRPGLGGFVVNDKTKVDENLFYKGVDKKAVHGARLHQITPPSELEPNVMAASASHSPSVDETAEPATEPQEEAGPPYPFSSGNTLLELTKKHNVSCCTRGQCESNCLLDDHCSNRMG